MTARVPPEETTEFPCGQTVRSFWEERVHRSAGDVFLIHNDGEWSYEDFDGQINSVANGLHEHGVRAGTHVALLLPNSRELLRVELALQKLGAVMIPIIAGVTHAEAMFVLTHSDAEVLITDGAGWSLLQEEGGFSLESPPKTYVLGGEAPVGAARPFSSLESMNAEPPPVPAIDAADQMALMYTSGSTGRPKGVIVPNFGMATAGRGIAARLEMTSDDTVLAAMPFFHIAALNMMFAPAVAAGASMAMMDRFDRRHLWPFARRSGATLSLLIPAHLSLLMAEPESPEDQDHALRTVMSHIRPKGFCERFGVDVCTTWAMTETSAMGTLTPRRYEGHKAKLIGKPYPDTAEISVVDPDGTALPPGELGDLCLRHPHVMTGYYKDPDNTSATLRDGWVRSGDLCMIDAEGNAYFHGRIKNVIKRAGENIAGEEVEFTIMGHPKVQECIVFGVEDPIMTEEVAAVIVVPERDAPTAEEVIAWTGAHLSSWKAPRFVTFQSEPLAKLANGKTNRKSIIADFEIREAWDRRRHV